jgi:hypothetical protein
MVMPPPVNGVGLSAGMVKTGPEGCFHTRAAKTMPTIHEKSSFFCKRPSIALDIPV